jgi:hypothetical protein
LRLAPTVTSRLTSAALALGKSDQSSAAVPETNGAA